MAEPNADLGDGASMTGNGQGVLVPPCRTLSGFACEADCREGIAIGSLASGTRLNVLTQNSHYRLIVLDGDQNPVVVQGGAKFPKAVPAHFQGASAGGSLLRTGWIEVGFRMELCVGSQRIITSPVRSVSVAAPPPADIATH